jgi:hypothetical protein
MTDAEHHGSLSAISDAGHKFLITLPGQFLALCLINVLFLIGLLYFLAHQSDARERIIQSIVDRCVGGQAK